MIKYAKIINPEMGLVEVGLGTNSQFYKSIGMTQLDVQQSDIDGSWYLIDKCPMKSEEQKELEEKERIAHLSLTKREVFLALYQSKGITPDTIKAQITDPQALIEFEYATEYYRGNPLIDIIGETLGFSSKDLDYLFQNKVLPNNIPTENLSNIEGEE